MNISVVGACVALLLFLLGRRLGSGAFIGLFAALPFGTTAIGTLGGSTPLIFTLFEMLALAFLYYKRQELMATSRAWTDWLVLALAFYVLCSAMILPRLFAGDISIGSQVSDYGMIAQPLAPVFGNVTQAGYFLLGCATYFAFRVLLVAEWGYFLVRRGFFTFAFLNAALGMLDLVGKVMGITDVLSPLRTAAYMFRTSEYVAGFWRIAGGYPEASAFAAGSVAALAFCFSYWRQTGSPGAGILSVWLVALIIISTSTAAYVSLGIICIPVACSIVWSLLNGRIASRDLFLVAIALSALTVFIGLYLAAPNWLDPVIKLVSEMVLNKSTSMSAIERGYWNSKSLEAFVETSGLGIGIGSSRASSWVIAVLAQLGIIGSLAMSVLVFILLRGLYGLRIWPGCEDLAAITAAARASALASLIVAGLISGSADPGILVFIGLAVVASSRAYLQLGCPREVGSVHRTLRAADGLREA